MSTQPLAVMSALGSLAVVVVGHVAAVLFVLSGEVDLGAVAFALGLESLVLTALSRFGPAFDRKGEGEQFRWSMLCLTAVGLVISGWMADWTPTAALAVAVMAATLAGGLLVTAWQEGCPVRDVVGEGFRALGPFALFALGVALTVAAHDHERLRAAGWTGPEWAGSPFHDLGVLVHHLGASAGLAPVVAAALGLVVLQAFHDVVSTMHRLAGGRDLEEFMGGGRPYAG